MEDGSKAKLLPCLLTVLRDINEPAMPTLSGKKAARRAALTVQGMDSLGLSPDEAGLAGSPTRVRRIFRPSLARNPRIFKAGDIEEGIVALFDELESRGLIDEQGPS